LPSETVTVLLETELPLGAVIVTLETVSLEVEVLFETTVPLITVLFETTVLLVTVTFEMVTFVALQGNINTGMVNVILEYL